MSENEKTYKCRSCGREVTAENWLNRGTFFNPEKHNAETFRGRCPDCDYTDYLNSYGGM